MQEIERSEFDIKDQEKFIRDTVEVIALDLPPNTDGFISNPKKKENNEGDVAVVSDTHGDFISLLVSLLEAGVISIKKNDFTYYDIENNKFITEEEASRKKMGTVCVIPTPYFNPKYKGEFYHLGDFVDRGMESVTSLVFLYRIINLYEEKGIKPSIKLVAGNHDICHFLNNNTRRIYIKILKELALKGYIKAGYLKGEGEKAVLFSHSIFLDKDLNLIFEKLKKAIKQTTEQTTEQITGILTEKKFENTILSAIKAFLVDEKELTEKLEKFFKTKDFTIIKDDEILKEFTPIELAKIKIIVGNAIIKEYLGNISYDEIERSKNSELLLLNKEEQLQKLEKNSEEIKHKSEEYEEHCKKINTLRDQVEKIKKLYELYKYLHYFEKNFLYPLFWSRYEDIKQKNAKPIDISQVVGHDANEKAVLFHTENNHSILFVDNKRSYTYRKFVNSEPTTNASTVFLVSDQKGKIVLEKPHIVSETIRRNAFFDHPSTTTIPIKKPERPFEIGRLPTLNKKQQKTNSEQQQKERKTSSYPPLVSTRVSMNQRQRNQKITSTSNTKYKITKPIIKKNSSNHSLNSGICRI